MKQFIKIEILIFHRNLIIIGLLFLIGFSSFSQKNGQFYLSTQNDDLDYTITHYSSKHGLPQNQVSKIIEIGNGNLVLSTGNGIVKFDGDRFSDFIVDRNHKNQFYENIFYEEKSKQLFGSIRKKSFNIIYPITKKLINACASDVYEGQIFVINAEGELSHSPSDNINFLKLISTKIKNATDIKILNSSLFISSEEGLFKYDLKSKKLKHLVKKSILKIKILGKNQLYFLTDNSLEKVDLESNKSTMIFHNLEKGIILSDVVELGKNEYYVGSDKGLYHITFDGKTKSKRLKYPSENIHSLVYLKRANCLVMGTNQRGLFKLDFKSIKHLFNPMELNSNSVSSVTLFQNRILTMGTSGVLYDMTNPSNVSTYLKTKYTYSMLASIDNQLLIGTWSYGLVFLKDKKIIKIIKGTKHFYDDYIHAIFKDSKNQFWFGTEEGISFGKTLETARPLIKTNSYVCCFYELKDKTICVGTEKGIYFINPALKITKFIGRENGYTGKQVRCFYEDSEGKLWIGTYNGGLYCYFKNKMVSINNMTNCKLPQDIFCIVKDENDVLYFTGNLGLFGVQEDKLNDFYFKRSQYLIPFYFGEESGLINTEFNGGFQRNYLKINTLFYFPTIEGLVAFSPKKQLIDHSELKIDNVLIDDTIVPMNKKITLTQNSSIQFQFSKPNFNTNNLVFYQFKLEKDGVKMKWGAPIHEKTLNFSKLTAGRYKLSIRVIDSHNISFPKVITHSFEVLPKFYQTTAFYFLMSVFMLSLGGAIVKYQSKKNQIRVRLNNQILELKLSAIQSRMNPHFIFNSLNNIKYFLLIENKEKAEKLIDDFSTLLRKFLSYSDKEFIRIEDELNLLILYLKIENSRFQDSFEIVSEVDEELKKEYIPTLLIQPFLENAIKHGISNSEKTGKISLFVHKKGEWIIVKIIDNGIGIEKHKQENKPKSGHVSSGIKLVKDKIQNLKAKYGIQIKLTVESKEDEGSIITIEILNNYHDVHNN